MRVVELRVTRAHFVDRMGAMRGWFDRSQYPDIRFETSTVDGEIHIRVEFPTPEMASVFRESFGGVSAEAG